MIATLRLLKGDELFIVRYELGDEQAVCNHLCEMVRTQPSFDWFDAAVMSYQMGVWCKRYGIEFSANGVGVVL